MHNGPGMASRSNPGVPLGLAAALLALALLACGGTATEGQHLPPAEPAILGFTAAQNPVTAGTATMLTASYVNGTGTIDLLGMAASGSPVTTGPLVVDTPYTLIVDGAGGTTPATRSLTVRVVPAPEVPVITAPTTIMAGQGGYTASVPLQPGMDFRWTVSGGAITAGAGTAQVTFSAGAAGAMQLSCQAVNAAGTASPPGTAALTVVQGPVISLFSATPASLVAGQPCTLSWAATGFLSLAIDNGVGQVSGSSVTVTPGASTVYTLTATSAAGSVSSSVPVTVVPQGQRPVITSFSASPATVAAGSGCTLSWAVSWAGSVSLDQGIGPVTGTSFTVVPAGTTTYTLTAANAVGTAQAQVTVTVAAAPPGNPFRFTLPGGVVLDMVYLPPGHFTMGSVNLVDSGAQPPHTVTLSRGFYLGRFLVTQSQYQAVTGVNPASNDRDPRLPVECVSWDDLTQAGGFLTMLNALAAPAPPPGLTFRLPTEAEWEYACRAGTITEWYFGNDPAAATQNAWYVANCTSTKPVGQLPANPFGLFDMIGNVWEWCQDAYGSYTAAAQTDPVGPPHSSTNSRVCRGGAAVFALDQLRSAYRYRSYSGNRLIDIGFRVALAPPASPAP